MFIPANVVDPRRVRLGAGMKTNPTDIATSCNFDRKPDVVDTGRVRLGAGMRHR